MIEVFGSIDIQEENYGKQNGYANGIGINREKEEVGIYWLIMTVSISA